MESKTEFHKINTIEKIFFKLSIATICTIVGNICLILLFIFYNEYSTLPKIWIGLNVLVILALGGFFIKKLKLNNQSILSAGFFTFLIFPIFWMAFPLKIPQEYAGLRQTNEEGFILADEYCKKDCIATQRLIKQGYNVERNYYSWRYAELLGRIPSNDSCCYNTRPFESKYFFGILVLLELTFEYLPIIFILTLLTTIFEYYKRKDIDAFGKEFIATDDFDIRKINVWGVSVIVIIVLYNILYMNSV